jgi:hypothetical protein
MVSVVQILATPTAEGTVAVGAVAREFAVHKVNLKSAVSVVLILATPTAVGSVAVGAAAWEFVVNKVSLASAVSVVQIAATPTVGDNVAVRSVVRMALVALSARYFLTVIVALLGTYVVRRMKFSVRVSVALASVERVRSEKNTASLFSGGWTGNDCDAVTNLTTFLRLVTQSLLKKNCGLLPPFRAVSLLRWSNWF